MRFNSGAASTPYVADHTAWNSSPLTDRAAARIAEIVAEPKQAPRPRCASPCWPADAAASSTASSWTSTPQADDLVIERGPARVLVDPASLDLLAGSELDYTDELMGSHFAVRNPNAKSACGCGTSFSID